MTTLASSYSMSEAPQSYSNEPPSVPQQRYYSLPPATLQTPTLAPNYSYHGQPFPHALRPAPIMTGHQTYQHAYSTHNPPLSPPTYGINMSKVQGIPRSAPQPSMHSRETFRTPSPTPYTVERQPSYNNSPPRRAANTRSPIMLPPHLQLPTMGPDITPDTMRCTDFVAKLWFLLDHAPEYGRHIRWNGNGESFIFYPTNEFATEVLSRLYKHSNVASFVRQLNLYGFQRISHLELLEDMQEGGEESSSAPANIQQFHDSESSVPASGFMHPDFVRGNPSTLGKIRPKPSPSRKRNTASGGAKKRSRKHFDDEEEAEAGAELSDLSYYPGERMSQRLRMAR